MSIIFPSLFGLGVKNAKPNISLPDISFFCVWRDLAVLAFDASDAEDFLAFDAFDALDAEDEEDEDDESDEAAGDAGGREGEPLADRIEPAPSLPPPANSCSDSDEEYASQTDGFFVRLLFFGGAS